MGILIPLNVDRSEFISRQRVKLPNGSLLYTLFLFMESDGCVLLSRGKMSDVEVCDLMQIRMRRLPDASARPLPL